MVKEYDLYNAKQVMSVKVKRINIHSYNIKGYPNTEFANVYKRVSVEELNNFKKRFNLYTSDEIKKRKEKFRRPNTTVMDLLVKANFNININTGDFEEDNKSEMLGKYQLKQVMDLLSNGKDLSDVAKVAE
ncbi:hypothetical protein BU110_00570 [Staphylococcus shinii]|uniref:hypothetical protein n=1 Tax=Staphylococcus TaxID=1279 RepID=UPI000D1DA843|nr:MULTISPECIES: hypothetical protein [Staphylococcus]PTI68081.1 hypothetical protein BU110_00570 [Staphylococcus shinii]RIM80081.1 hypothetical protein BU116_01120 [Staphylococcus xylosus]